MFYVVIANYYGTTESVEVFETKKEAMKYMESLDEDLYMVILRNDEVSAPAFREVV